MGIIDFRFVMADTIPTGFLSLPFASKDHFFFWLCTVREKGNSTLSPAFTFVNQELLVKPDVPVPLPKLVVDLSSNVQVHVA
jgi:hypothetical protein